MHARCRNAPFLEPCNSFHSYNRPSASCKAHWNISHGRSIEMAQGLAAVPLPMMLPGRHGGQHQFATIRLARELQMMEA